MGTNSIIAATPKVTSMLAAGSFAGYPSTGTNAHVTHSAHVSGAAQHTTPTLVAARKDDARVPEPRGRTL